MMGLRHAIYELKIIPKYQDSVLLLRQVLMNIPKFDILIFHSKVSIVFFLLNCNMGISAENYQLRLYLLSTILPILSVLIYVLFESQHECSVADWYNKILFLHI